PSQPLAALRLRFTLRTHIRCQLPSLSPAVAQLRLVRPMKIYGALINAFSLDEKSPYYGRPGGCSIQYYALAQDPENFANRVKEFLARELWQLGSFEIGGEMSRELLLQSGKQHIVDSLDSHGDAAVIHFGQFSDN